MKISEKRAVSTFTAISDPITNLRIKSNAGLSIEEMDKKLFALQQEIWKKVRAALNMDTAL